MRFTRRAVLTLPSVAIVRPAAARTLSVEATADGGFRVIGAEPTWGKTGAELCAAFGDDTRVVVSPEKSQVTLRGALAGQTLLLEFTFGRSGGALVIVTRGRLGSRLSFDGRPRRLPLLLDEHVDADSLTREVGLSARGVSVKLDDALALHLISQEGFAFGQGVSAHAPLRLLAANPSGRLAASGPPQARMSAPVR